MTTVTVTKSHFEKLSIRKLLNTIFDHMKQENLDYTDIQALETEES